MSLRNHQPPKFHVTAHRALAHFFIMSHSSQGTSAIFSLGLQKVQTWVLMRVLKSEKS